MTYIMTALKPSLIPFIQIEKEEQDTPSRPIYRMVDKVKTEKQILYKELRAERNLVRYEWSRLVKEIIEKYYTKKHDDKVAEEEEERKK